MRKLYLLVLFMVVALACRATTPAPPPTPDMVTVVAQTLMAYTAEAAMTQVAAPTQTSPPAASDTAVPPASDTPSPTPEENAPDPLPASHTGVILNNGECFNFDNGQVTAPDSQCDVWLAEPALLRQRNGAQLSGYVTLAPPARSHCAAGRYEPGDLAVQTDLYMCFISNEGQIGFMVARGYRGEAPLTGIVFDYWVFR
jgi:hypothetical protein